MSDDLATAVLDFLTAPVALPSAPKRLPLGSVWQEVCGGWRYPWRVTRYLRGVAQGYPCGEPTKVFPCMCGATDDLTHDIGDGLERCVHCGCH